jgi:hypothetical protein
MLLLCFFHDDCPFPTLNTHLSRLSFLITSYERDGIRKEGRKEEEEEEEEEEEDRWEPSVPKNRLGRACLCLKGLCSGQYAWAMRRLGVKNLVHNEPTVVTVEFCEIHDATHLALFSVLMIIKHLTCITIQ